jgi:UDP-2,3-diacylglucosamine hydrolase
VHKLDTQAGFVSDVHLGPGPTSETLLRFENSLLAARGQISSLVLLGDLFDTWLGDDVLQAHGLPMQATALRVIEAIASLGEGQNAAFPVFIARGNRDFLLGEGFIQALRLKGLAATLLTDEAMMDVQLLDGSTNKVLVSHGDQWCTDDTDYQNFRTKVRSAEWQAEFLGHSLEQRIAIARQLREGSESAKQNKSNSIMDVNREAILRAFNSKGVDTIVHGHTHRPATHRYSIDGSFFKRIVLPDWDAGQTIGQKNEQSRGELICPFSSFTSVSLKNKLNAA